MKSKAMIYLGEDSASVPVLPTLLKISKVDLAIIAKWKGEIAELDRTEQTKTYDPYFQI